MSTTEADESEMNDDTLIYGPAFQNNGNLPQSSRTNVDPATVTTLVARNSEIAIDVTRVMSPSVDPMLERWGIRGATQPCEWCNQVVTDLWVCSACYRSGHKECMQADVLEGYAFCAACQPWTIEQLSRFRTEAQKELWTARLANQLANWRAMTTTATGALGAVGMAIGGASAMVISGTSALVRGVAQGARSTSGVISPAALEDGTTGGNIEDALPLLASSSSGPQPASSTQPQTAEVHGPPAPGCHGIVGSGHTRSRSEEPPTTRMTAKQASAAGHCLACHTANRGHLAHLYAGDCVLFSGQTAWGKKAVASEAEQSAEGQLATDALKVAIAAGITVPDSFESLEPPADDALASKGAASDTPAVTPADTVGGEDSLFRHAPPESTRNRAKTE